MKNTTKERIKEKLVVSDQRPTKPRRPKAEEELRKFKTISDRSSYGAAITERKKVEEALRRSEEIFSAFMNSATDAFTIWDSELNLINLNLAALKYLPPGVQREDVIGKNLRVLEPEAESSGRLDEFRKIIKTGKPFSIDTLVLNMIFDGEVADRYLNVRAFRVDEGLGIMTIDITERKRAEEALQVLTSRHEATLAAVPDIIMEVDVNKVYTWANKAGYQFFGDDVIGKEAADYFEGEQKTYSVVSPLFKGAEDTIYVESWQRRKDGKKRLLAWWCRVLKDSDGRVTGALSTARDITEQNQAEEELRKFKTISDRSSYGAAISDLEGNLIYVNKAFADMHQYEPEELIGKNLSIFHNQEQMARVKQLNNKLKQEGAYSAEEVWDKRKDGSIFPILMNATIIQDNGTLLYISATAIDITELKELEEEQRNLLNREAASAREWENTFDAALDIITLISPDHRILKVNKAGDEPYGMRPEDLVGKKCYELVHGLDGPIKGCPCKETVETKKAGSGEIEEHGRHFIVTASPVLDKNDELVYFVHTVKDITEIRKMEKQLRQNFENLQKVLEGTVNALVSATELRDPYTAGHQQRVSKLASAIAKELGFTDDKINAIRLACLIHDVGKINVPAELLSKPGKLTEIEFSVIKNHPQAGYDILKKIDFAGPVAQMVLQHHERINGSGYPTGISGEDMLLEARIMAVADVVEAMASHRPYRPALGIKKAIKEISKNKGVLYDPDVVDACLKLFRKEGFILD